MFRVVCLLACCTCAATASAQQWAEKMFDQRSVDFGGVPRAAKVEHEFVITNPYKEEVHIAHVRSSCGCTQPRIENDTLQSWEKGKIIAAFNTQSFTGQHGATVTVTFDRPQWAEVQLQVKGYIRTDVVLDPKFVNFGTITQGQAGDKQIRINYAGRGDWKITGVKSNSPYVTADVKEIERAGGRIGYQLDVKLADSAPAGYLTDQIMLTTSDRRGQFPVAVEARVVPQLTVSPAALSLGSLEAGETVKKQIVVKGAKPFRIVDIRCENSGFKFQTPAEAKALHLVPLEFTAPDTAGKVNCQIEIVTDLDDSRTVSLKATGDVTAPLAAN